MVVLHHGPEDGGGGSQDVLVAGNLVAIEDQGEICPLHIVSFAGVGWTDGPLRSVLAGQIEEGFEAQTTSYNFPFSAFPVPSLDTWTVQSSVNPVSHVSLDQ